MSLTMHAKPWYDLLPSTSVTVPSEFIQQLLLHNTPHNSLRVVVLLAAVPS